MVEAFRPIKQTELQGCTKGELSEESIFNLLSSVGDGEHHGLTLIVSQEGVVYSRESRYKEILNHQRKGREWRISSKALFDYCEDSLLPAHLVTRKAISSLDGAKWGHRITNYGLDPGLAFVGILLRWSHEHPNHSLYKMFGIGRLLGVSDEYTQETKSIQKTRHRILGQISICTDIVRQKDILHAIDEDQKTISEHVGALSKNGVIAHDSIRGRTSIISVSSEQKEAIDSLLSDIDKFKSGDKEITQEGREFAESVLNDPDLFSELMLKAKEASPFANKTGKESMHSYLISILHENPNSTVNQILRILEEKYGKKYTHSHTVRQFLSELVKGGEISSGRTKSENVYRVADSDIKAT